MGNKILWSLTSACWGPYLFIFTFFIFFYHFLIFFIFYAMVLIIHHRYIIFKIIQLEMDSLSLCTKRKKVLLYEWGFTYHGIYVNFFSYFSYFIVFAMALHYHGILKGDTSLQEASVITFHRCKINWKLCEKKLSELVSTIPCHVDCKLMWISF